MSGLCERKRRILKEVSKKGYYELYGQYDLDTCRKIYRDSADIGMKRIERSRWFIFTKEGVENLINDEHLSESDANKLKRYAKKMLSDTQ